MVDQEGYDKYIFHDVEPDQEHPVCMACGDPVKIIYHSGVPKYAQHCSECYAELRWGKVPAANRRRRPL